MGIKKTLAGNMRSPQIRFACRVKGELNQLKKQESVFSVRAQTTEKKKEREKIKIKETLIKFQRGKTVLRDNPGASKANPADLNESSRGRTVVH